MQAAPHTAFGIRRKSASQRGEEQLKHILPSPSIEITNVPSNDLLFKHDSHQNIMLATENIGRHLYKPPASKRNIITDLLSKHS